MALIPLRNTMRRLWNWLTGSNVKTAKRPSRVRIGPIEYKIKYKKKMPPLVGEEEAETCGQHHPSVSQILLKDGMGDDFTGETLFHEIIHGIFSQGPHSLNYEEEESLVMLISSPLLDTLKRNPEVCHYLLGD